jgi:zinc transport system ATP-binding protein
MMEGVETTDTHSEVISIQHLWAGYDREAILEDINLSVKEQDFIGIIGPNGGGKTTLFRVLLGLVPPQRGRVRVLDRNVKQGRRYIGYVPQAIAFDRDFPINVRDVVRMGRLGKGHLLRRYSDRDDAKVEQALRQVELLDLSDRPIAELSEGQQQRVYIARALATEPKILLLDEPTTSLDRQVSANIYELLEQLNEFVTILTISHDIGAVSSHIKTVGCLNKRLYYHGNNQITREMLETAYGGSVEQIVHTVPQRILAEHETVHD